MLSVTAPDMFKCVAAVSSWIRKEEYSNGNDFFNLDASKPFVPADTVYAASLAMSEFHVDSLAANLKELDVFIRVGSQDKTTHPWFSRRMVSVTSDVLQVYVSLSPSIYIFVCVCNIYNISVYLFMSAPYIEAPWHQLLARRGQRQRALVVGHGCSKRWRRSK